jgi:hypothetical protein
MSKTPSKKVKSIEITDSTSGLEGNITADATSAVLQYLQGTDKLNVSKNNFADTHTVMLHDSPDVMTNLHVGLTGMQLVEATSTPAVPSAGNMKIYSKIDEKIYKLSPSGVETEIGTGGGGGGSGTSCKVTVTQASHGFVPGDFLTINFVSIPPPGFKYDKISVHAQATPIGIVESVTDSNTFILVVAGVLNTSNISNIVIANHTQYVWNVSNLNDSTIAPLLGDYLYYTFYTQSGGQAIVNFRRPSVFDRRITNTVIANTNSGTTGTVIDLAPLCAISTPYTSLIFDIDIYTYMADTTHSNKFSVKIFKPQGGTPIVNSVSYGGNMQFNFSLVGSILQYTVISSDLGAAATFRLDIKASGIYNDLINY